MPICSKNILNAPDIFSSFGNTVNDTWWDKNTKLSQLSKIMTQVSTINRQ